MTRNVQTQQDRENKDRTTDIENRKRGERPTQQQHHEDSKETERIEELKRKQGGKSA